MNNNNTAGILTAEAKSFVSEMSTTMAAEQDNFRKLLRRETITNFLPLEIENYTSHQNLKSLEILSLQYPCFFGKDCV